MASITDLQKVLGVTFSNVALLEQALTHRSYLNEHKELDRAHNERLEFLGDAVLELATTTRLFNEYPNDPEGNLTAYRAALVNTNSLSVIGESLELGKYLLLSRGESKDMGRARQYILANTVEAIIGAIYLDQGYEAAEGFIERNFYSQLEDIIANRLWQDSKSYFQEKAQQELGDTPTYTVLSEDGPDHDKEFRVGVFVQGELLGEGTGASKQEAEQSAAEAGLTHKGWR